MSRSKDSEAPMVEAALRFSREDEVDEEPL